MWNLRNKTNEQRGKTERQTKKRLTYTEHTDSHQREVGGEKEKCHGDEGGYRALGVVCKC